VAKINGDMVRADLTKILHLINPEKVAEKILLKMTKVREDFSAYAIRLVAKDIYAVEDIVARYCKFYLENEYQGTSVGFNHALAVMKKRVSKHLGEFEQLYQDVIWGRLSLRELVDSIHNANVEAEVDQYLDSMIDRFVPPHNGFYHEVLVAEYLERHRNMLPEQILSLPAYRIDPKYLLKMHYKMVDRIQKKLASRDADSDN